MKQNKHEINGWINLDKPYGMTSTQAVGAVKRLLRPKKIGHAGTLDPLATGILPLALGEATKTVAYLMDARKTYRFTLKFGEETTTCDAEGDVIATSAHRPSDEEIRAALPRFCGTILQIPPAFSAIKIDGMRAYDLARAGVEVEMQPREVWIGHIQMLERPDQDHAVLEVRCGKGTYIRSLARDLAEALGTKGHVSALRRLAVGGFDESNRISLEILEEMVHSPASDAAEALENPVNLMFLLPVRAALDDIPAIRIGKEEAHKLRHGQPAHVARTDFPATGNKDTLYQAICVHELVALVERDGTMIAPVRVFAPQAS